MKRKEHKDSFEGTVHKLGCCLSGDRLQAVVGASEAGRTAEQRGQEFGKTWRGIGFGGADLIAQGDMNPRICKCCGEPIHEEGNALSRNPNVCASCSSLADGMEDSNVCLVESPTLNEHAPTEAAGASEPPDASGLEPATHLVSSEA